MNIMEIVEESIKKVTGNLLAEKKSTEYQKFFQAELKKAGVKSPAELSPEEKKKFFENVDAKWKSTEEDK